MALLSPAKCIHLISLYAANSLISAALNAAHSVSGGAAASDGAEVTRPLLAHVGHVGHVGSANSGLFIQECWNVDVALNLAGLRPGT